jgi:uncharacterized membrane protein
VNGARDVRLERWLGRVLSVGVAVSTVLLGAGLALALAGAAPGTSARLLRIGLIALMATPVARVVISVVEYGSKRDWAFVALTATVLGMLMMSFVIS